MFPCRATNRKSVAETATRESQLAAARVPKELSQEELARPAGLSTSAVFDAEHGRRRARSSTRKALAEALNLAEEELFS
jgi:transcriptional regulator with XRE-family HTH domain